MRFFKSNRHNDISEVSTADDDAVERIDNQYPDDYPEYEGEYEPEQSKRHKKLKKIILRLLFLCFLLIAVNVFVLFFTGKLWFNQPDKDEYPIRGALVDSAMGEINWKTFSHQNIKVAYIRATKGTGFKDESFDQNWKNSSECNLMTGAYHVFSLKKNGREQAEYFCNALDTSFSGRIVPAVQVKLSGIDMILAPDKADVIKHLKEFTDYFEQNFDISPLIICDNRSYEKYIEADFKSCPIMITDYFSTPDDDIEWDFWCFNPRVRLKGYKNSKQYISMFVCGQNISTDDFKEKYLC